MRNEAYLRTRKYSKIQERLLESDSFLLVCKNQEDEIVGYMDGYIDNLETIFRRELHYHYSEVGYTIIQERVETILGYIPPDIMSFSSMGLSEKYTNFFIIFQMLNAFAKIIPEKHLIPGITELNKNNNLYDLYGVMGRKSLWIGDVPKLHEKIRNTGENYDSDIVVYDNPVKDFKENFAMGIKDFLRIYKQKRRVK